MTLVFAIISQIKNVSLDRAQEDQAMYSSQYRLVSLSLLALLTLPVLVPLQGCVLALTVRPEGLHEESRDF